MPSAEARPPKGNHAHLAAGPVRAGVPRRANGGARFASGGDHRHHGDVDPAGGTGLGDRAGACSWQQVIDATCNGLLAECPGLPSLDLGATELPDARPPSFPLWYRGDDRPRSPP